MYPTLIRKSDHNEKQNFSTGGSDYEINANHSLGVNIQASQSNGENIGKSLTEINNPGTDDLFFIRSLNDADSRNERIFGNFHYVGILDSLGTKITTDVDYTKMRSNSTSLLTNNNWINESEHLSNRDFILTLNEMDYSIFTAKADFTKPFGKGKVLEAGLKGSWVKSDNILDLSKALEEEPLLPKQQSLYLWKVLAA